MSMMINSYAFGSGIQPFTRWRYRYVYAGQSNGDHPSFSELKFLANPGDAAMPDNGVFSAQNTPTFNPGTSSLSCLNDGNTTTYAYFDLVDNWVEFAFDSPQIIRAVRLAARSDTSGAATFERQVPTWGFVEYFDGAAWQQAADISMLPILTLGGSREADFSKQVDEPGGHRYWWVEMASNFEASAFCTFSEIELFSGGVQIEPERIRRYDPSSAYNQSGGIAAGSAVAAWDHSYTTWVGWSTAYPHNVKVDFGHKRKIDEIRIHSRTDSFPRQCPKTGTIYFNDVDDFATATVATTYAASGTTPAGNQVVIPIP